MSIVIRGGRVFDVVTGEFQAADVVLDSERITGVSAGLDADVEFDATGLTVLPGLIDAHVHVMVPYFDTVRLMETPFSQFFYYAEQNLRKTLDIGITYVRDANGADLGVQRAVAEGMVEGPDLDISVQALGQTGGHSDFWMPSGLCVPLLPVHPGRPDGVVDGPDQMRLRVREVIRAGADVIKLNVSGGVISPRGNPRHPQLRPDEIAEAVAEANAVGIPVMAHAHGTDGVKNALRAGVRSIEHGTYLDDECIQLMLDNGVWLVPTLGVVGALLDGIAAGASMPDAVVAKLREGRDAHLASVRRAIEAGVRIAMGSDAAALGHGRNLGELAEMHALGMAPADVLRAATISAAELMQHGDLVGSVEAGKRGDLTLVAGDPFDFKAYPGNVRAVFKRGVQVRDYTDLGR
ncbi:metal-dependent hydrolase family protein [Dactylosporangium darangshiense]|uniref:Amidohydrolase family protein n=1 Tax=Dactylosporangium darangshiense TaxID=579108 RepID=A0ABP8DCX8_9ACTN